MSSGLSERTRERTRREIADAAGQLFIEKGYAATTVKDIAEAADVSSRTFFRYFPSKEDVVTDLASSTMDATIDLLGQHDKGDSLLSALKVVLHATLARVADDPEPARKFQFLLRDTPELRGRWLEEQRRNRDRLAERAGPLVHQALEPDGRGAGRWRSLAGPRRRRPRVGATMTPRPTPRVCSIRPWVSSGAISSS